MYYIIAVAKDGVLYGMYSNKIYSKKGNAYRVLDMINEDDYLRSKGYKVYKVTNFIMEEEN